MNVNNKYSAAGVLFYAISMDNTLYFLLGKNNNNKWEGFGGNYEIKDKKEPETTAARESWEETLGCIDDIENIKSMIKNKDTLEIKTNTSTGKIFILYLVKIPFGTIYRDKFLSTYKFINKLNLPEHFYEIQDIKWFSFDTIKLSLEYNKSVIKLRNIFLSTIKSNISVIKQLQN